MYLQEIRLLLADFAGHFVLSETVRKDTINPEIIEMVSPQLSAEIASLPFLDREKLRLLREFESAGHNASQNAISASSENLCTKVESEPIPPVNISFNNPLDMESLEEFVQKLECINLCLFTSETTPPTPKLDREDLADVILELQADIEASGEEIDPEFYNDATEQEGVRIAFEIVADSLNRLRSITPKTPYPTGITAKDLPTLSGFTSPFEPVGAKYLN
jgi:hypothetical protein